MDAYVNHKAGPFAAAPTATGFASLENVQSDFPDAEQHIQKLVAEYAEDHPDSDPAGRDTLIARQLLDPKEAVSQIVIVPSGVDVRKVHSPGELFLFDEPGMWCTMIACSTRSMSRGYVHINCSDPTVHPTMDPAYLTHPLDVDMMARVMLHLLTFTEIEPLKSVLRRDEHGNLITAQGSGTLPTTLEKAKEHVRRSTSTQYHQVGSCAMLPREKGGAVSDELRVYGTSNVRVVDGSIFPTNVQGNIVSLVYALAEKGADIIKGKIVGG
jgi:choline dehydrogenase